MFKESLHAMPAGAWLALSLDESPDHEPPTRNLELAYAKLLLSDGTEQDLMQLLSIPVSPDMEAAKEMERTAAGQLEVAKSHSGKKSEAQYRRNSVRYKRQAEALRKFTRQMPKWIFPLRDSRVLCAYQLHRAPVLFREVDIESGEEHCRFDAGAISACLSGSPPIPDIAKQIRSHRASSSVIPGPLLSALKIKPLSASSGRLLLDVGMGRALVAWSADEFVAIARWPSMHGAWPAAARTSRGFVFHCSEGHLGSQLVHHVRADDGSEIARWRSSPGSMICEIASSPGERDVIILTSMGKPAELWLGTDAAPTPLSMLLPIDTHDAVEAAVCPQARVIGMRKSFDGNTIQLHDRHGDLVSCVGIPAPELLDSEFGRTSRTPTFEVTDADVLILSAGRLTRLGLPDLDWQPLPLPSIPIQRLRTPLLTMEQALRHGPLADVSKIVRQWFRPSLVLEAVASTDAKITIGGSKSGGSPDLPLGSEWLRFHGRPMAFLLQVDLKEVTDSTGITGLPAEGLLSVFLALSEDYPMPSFYGEENQDPSGCRVVFTPSGQSLQRLAMPPDMPDDYRQADASVCSFRLRRGGLMLPALSSDVVRRANLSLAQGRAYRELASAVNGDVDDADNWHSRLGGYPAQLQNDDLHLHAETYSRGADIDEIAASHWSDPEFQETAAEWRQLFQLAEGKEGWSWGDAGLMHIMVRGDQWDSAQFLPAWAIGVCH